MSSCLGSEILEKAKNESSNVEIEEIPENYHSKLDAIWVLGGQDGSSLVTQLEYYEPFYDRWNTADILDIPTPVRNAACAAYENKIYVFGGINGAGTVINSVQVYDVLANTWATDDNLPANRQGHSAVTADGNIFILGGSGTALAGGGTQTIYRFRPYNASGSRWSASLGNWVYTYTRMDSGFAYLDGEIIYGGGRYTNGAAYTHISTFWPSSNGYQNAVGYLRQARYAVTAAAYSTPEKKYVFFAGGSTVTNTAQFPSAFSPSSRVDIYQPYSENGIRVVLSGPTMINARAYAQSAVKGNYFYVMGGSVGTTNALSSVERLNAKSPFSSSWESRATMPRARRGFCAVTLR